MRNGSETSNSEFFLGGLSPIPNQRSQKSLRRFSGRHFPSPARRILHILGTVRNDDRSWISGSFALEMVHPCLPSVPRPLIKGGTTDDGSWHCFGTTRDDTGRRTRIGIEQGKHERTIVPLSPLDLAQSRSICLKTSGRRDDAPKRLRIWLDLAGSGELEGGGSGLEKSRF